MEWPLMWRSTHERLMSLQRRADHEAHLIEIEKLTEDYQAQLSAEYQRVLTLCRGQLHRWAADGFYELFQAGQLTGPRMRAMFAEAEKMLSPEKLLLREAPKED